MPIARRLEPATFTKLQAHFRARRFQLVLELIQSKLKEKDAITILDAGGRAEYWRLLPAQYRPRVRIVAVNYAEELQVYNVEEHDGLVVENIAGDARNMPDFVASSFDIAHSNSVIEHVGSYQDMASFAGEMRRIGKAYYVQTPNFWFPIDPHNAFPFLHWLPDPLRIRLMTMASFGLMPKTHLTGAMAGVDGTRMISRTMMKALFPDAVHRSEKFAFLDKSLIAIRA